MSRMHMQTDSPSITGSTARSGETVVGEAGRQRKPPRLRILVVTFCISPSTKVGAKRFEFLAREMVGRGHEVHLLGLRELGHRSTWPETDEQLPRIHHAGWYPLLGRLAATRPIRVLRRHWTRYIAPIDKFGGWILPTTLKGLWLVRRQRIDVVVATGPSFAGFATGYLISRATGSALILDYRDPWTWNRNAAPPSSVSRASLDARMEEAIVRAASCVVVVTERLKSDFLDRFSHAAGDKIHVVTNGLYLRNAHPGRPPEPRAFNVVYAGKFYGERNASYLIDAMAVLLEEGVIGKDGFMFHVFGVLTAADRERARRRGVLELVREWGFRPYQEVLRYLRGADLLYLPSGEEFQYAIPFKFFDYLSVERPILAVTSPESQLAEIVWRTGAGVVAEMGDREAIVEALRKIIAGGAPTRTQGIEEFLWGRLADRYLDLMLAAMDGVERRGVAGDRQVPRLKRRSR